MIFGRRLGVMALVLLAGMTAGVARATDAQAKPVKLQPVAHITNGFRFPQSVAVAPDGDIYVSDRANNRIQVLTPTGQFVFMFGWDVNETTEKEGAPQGERNLCTAESGDKCKSGVEGAAGEQLEEASALTIDPVSKDIYVQQRNRVGKYTADGTFIWVLGRKVDLTTGGNICTSVSKDSCGPGEESAALSSEPGAFKFELGGDQLAIGGPEELLYVSDEQRVQEFDQEGDWKGEISLASIPSGSEAPVVALAVDMEGHVYLVSRSDPTDIVREFSPSKKEVNSFTVVPREERRHIDIEGIALDGENHLAVSAVEVGEPGEGISHDVGLLLDAGTGRLITRFAAAAAEVSKGIQFDTNSGASPPDPYSGYLYAAVQNGEIVAYKPVNVAELVTSSVSCLPGETRDTDVTLKCVLNGDVDPWGVGRTEVWFQWGLTEALSEVSPEIDGHLASIQVPGTGETPLGVSAEITSVRPNEAAIRYRLDGYDENSGPPEEPEPLTSETASFSSPFVDPVIAGDPSTPYVRESSAVMFAELNPENASTMYGFEYVRAQACEELEAELGHKVELGECPGVVSTPDTESDVYGKIGTSQEVTGLQPATSYRYQLFAVAKSERQKKQETLEAKSAEVSFTTSPAAVPTAATGTAGSVGATFATISGSVDPDGEPATYTFELGVYAGASTQYGVVFSGPAGTGSAPIEEHLPVTGLQPGTTYSYRIAVKSGYTPDGEPVLGEPVLFVTEQLPSPPSTKAPALLEVPQFAFPKEPAKGPQRLTRAQKLTRALKACTKIPKGRRASCERSARKKYGPTGKSKK